jgi:hypothetical protein
VGRRRPGGRRRPPRIRNVRTSHSSSTGMIGYTPMSIGQRIHTVRTLFDAGIVTPTRPDKLVRIGMALRRFGPRPPPATPARRSAIRRTRPWSTNWAL